MDLTNFALPDGAHEAIQKSMRSVSLGNGVERMSGHDKGVAFRFFPHQERNELRTKLAGGIPMFDTIDMIQFYNDKYTRPVFIVTDEHKRKYADAWERYKAGREAPGLPLSRWNQITDAMVATFESQGIFTVEQLAALPESKIKGRFPKEFVEAYENAKGFVAGQAGRFELESQTSRIAELERENARVLKAMEEMREQIMSGTVPSGKSKSKPAKPKRKKVVQ